jgi:hypothetical protein
MLQSASLSSLVSLLFAKIQYNGTNFGSPHSFVVFDEFHIQSHLRGCWIGECICVCACFKFKWCLICLPNTRKTTIISSDYVHMLWILEACGLVSPVYVYYTVSYINIFMFPLCYSAGDIRTYLSNFIVLLKSR